MLANEEVINGRSERGNFPCVRRPLKQWMFRITEYADRLIEADLEGIDWPESTKARSSSSGSVSSDRRRDRVQGRRSRRARLQRVHHSSRYPVRLRRSCASWLRSTRWWQTNHHRRPAQGRRRWPISTRSAAKSELRPHLRVLDEAKKTGEFTGAYAINPLLPADDPRAKVPIWIADYVLATYGTGAVFAVPRPRRARPRVRHRLQLRDPKIVQVVPTPRAKTMRMRRTRSPVSPATASSINSEFLIDGLNTTRTPRPRRIIEWLEQNGARAGAGSTSSCATGCSAASATGASRSRSPGDPEDGHGDATARGRHCRSSCRR